MKNLHDDILVRVTKNHLEDIKKINIKYPSIAENKKAIKIYLEMYNHILSNLMYLPEFFDGVSNGNSNFIINYNLDRYGEFIKRIQDVEEEIYLLLNMPKYFSNEFVGLANIIN